MNAWRRRIPLLRLCAAAAAVAPLAPLQVRTSQERPEERSPTRLQDCRSVEFRARVYWPKEIAPDKYKLKFRWTLRVWARKPGYLRIETLPFPASRKNEEFGEPETHNYTAFTLLIADGKKMIDVAPARREYVLDDSLPDLESLLGPHMGQFVPTNFLFGPLPGVLKEDGTERIGGVAVTRFSESSPIPGTKSIGKIVVYMDMHRRLPIRVSELDTHENGEVEEVSRTDYSGWRFDRTLPDSLFDTKPPAGYSPYSPPPSRGVIKPKP